MSDPSSVTPAVLRHPTPVEKITYAFASALNILSAIWLASVAVLILCDVVGREVFGSPVYGTNEIVSNSVLSILFLQLPLSILTRAQLRTTIFYGGLSPRGKSVINIISYFLAALLFGAVAYGSWPNMIESWLILEQEGTPILTVPVYPIRTLVVVVSIVAVGVCALLIWESWTRPEEFTEV